MNYVYVIIATALLVTLVIFFVALAKLMKKVAGVNNRINELKENVNEVNEKTKQIEETKDSWRFFISIYTICLVLKQTISDYRSTKLTKRSITKSFSKTCTKNFSKIKKIKI